MLNNILEGVLPKTSIETPSHVDIYSMANFLAVRQHLNHESHQEIIDLTPLERAFIAARIAEQNRLDVELKNDIVCTSCLSRLYDKKIKLHVLLRNTPTITRNFEFVQLTYFYLFTVRI